MSATRDGAIATRFPVHNEQRRAPINEPPTYENPEATIRILEVWPWLAALQNQQLLPEAKIIRDQQHLWSDSRSNRPQQAAKHQPLPPIVDEQEADVAE